MTAGYLMLKRLWPTRCLICRQTIAASWPIEHLCAICFTILPWNTAACARCAQSLPSVQPYCAHCLNKPLLQQHTHILFQYASPISDWIRAAKFQASFMHCRLLGQLLSHTLLTQRTLPWPQCIIPMPLHPRRVRKRGYNQAIEIARNICREQAIPMDTHSLKRHRYQQPQSELTLSERKNNVHNSFRLQRHLTASHIALLDDVTTTGNTLIAASHALLMNGPLQLEHWCIAKPFLKD